MLTPVSSFNTTVSLKPTTTLFSSVSPAPLVSFLSSLLTVQLELLLSDPSPSQLRNGLRSLVLSCKRGLDWVVDVTGLREIVRTQTEYRRELEQ